MQNNWTIQQTKELFDLVKQTSDEGKGLFSAFETMSKRCQRSINSVRNYYYSQLKMFELVPSLADDLGIELVKTKREEFELFGEEEIVSLVRNILIRKAEGKSVRAVIAEMSGGNAKLALRLQNKYRSMIAHHKNKVTAIMNSLSREGIIYFDPYTKQRSDATDSDDKLTQLNEYISRLDASEVGNFLSLIKKLI